MGWEDRPYYQDDSRPVDGEFAPPVGPSLSLFTAFGVRVRTHYSLPLFVALMFVLTWVKGYSLASRIISMGALVVLLLIHEFGHCFAARAAGGDIDEVILWPLGGLGTMDVPRRRSAILAALGGPIANLTTCITCAAIVWFLAGIYVPLNPLHPLPSAKIDFPNNPALYAWWLFIVSYNLLLINLLPILPLDGARVLQALLRPTLGAFRAAHIGTGVGMAGAGILLIAGIALGPNFFLILLGLSLFLYCIRQRAALREAVFEDSPVGDGPDFSQSLREEKPVRPRRRVSRWKVRRLRRQAQREAAELQMIDAILAKVSTQGLHKLSWSERRVLKRATRRQREMDLLEK